MNDLGSGLEQLYGRPPQIDGDVSGPLATVQGENHLSPKDERFTTGVTVQGHCNHDFMWRGVIAKGGTPIFHARSVAIGKGLESDIPKVVNCSSITRLGLLTKASEEPDEPTPNRAPVCCAVEAILQPTNSTKNDLQRSFQSNHKLVANLDDHGNKVEEMLFDSYVSSVYQQPTNPVTMINQAHSANVSQLDTSMLLVTEKVVSELLNQAHPAATT
ncbi:hypothetical protein F0562_032161 [Nyssa sinensis]|uniref:Uncharacterized protein n=1 Tax=Nyssa sinensis TaxID=561372 RepID=A0A5J5AWD7_9ASTE|nr:hypothetical protein F0562_032161 [Nyssa sinensis]